MCIFKTEV